MGKTLTKHQLGEYQQQGFLFPLPVLSDSETAALRGNWNNWKQTRVAVCRPGSTESLTCS